jgi:hypothetical protein
MYKLLSYCTLAGLPGFARDKKEKDEKLPRGLILLATFGGHYRAHQRPLAPTTCSLHLHWHVFGHVITSSGIQKAPKKFEQNRSRTHGGDAQGAPVHDGVHRASGRHQVCIKRVLGTSETPIRYQNHRKMSEC